MTTLVLQKNETEAMWAVLNIRQLQNKYAVASGGKFAPTFEELSRVGNLDGEFRGENPVVSGYVFRMVVSPPSGHNPKFYMIIAEPLESEGNDQTGRVHFYTDSTLGTVRATRENRPATADDPTI